MEMISSFDNTPIFYRMGGSGPPLLLVHGTTADHSTTWKYVFPELEKHFTVYRMDRRGRGGTPASGNYHLKHEALDIVSFLSSIGEPAHLLGHSYGGLCAIEASLLTNRIRKLVLYEGVPLNGSDYHDPGVIDRIDDILRSGNREPALETMFRDIVKMTPDELEMMKSQKDAWQVRISHTPTIPRELREWDRYVFKPERFEHMETPVILLVGENSPEVEHQSANAIKTALMNAEISILSGQQHTAMYSAPDLFVSVVLNYLNG
jgi:pimeloyl-ACP methyl ester carboxylesterase